MSAHAAITGLQVFQCVSCHTHIQRVQMVCPQCLGREFHTQHIKATGTLASWTLVRKPPLRFKADGMYCVGVFDLENGMRITGRLLHQASDAIGDRVVAVTTNDASATLPTFKVTRNG
jgi:uncharacterized OB-fold protein